jgi:hypothetical protein
MPRRYNSWDARAGERIFRTERQLRVNFESSLASVGHGGSPPCPRPPHVTSEALIIPANGKSGEPETDRVSTKRFFGMHDSHAADCTIRSFEDVSRSIQHRLARCRERDAATITNEKYRADIVFEALDETAERRLRHHEAFGGAPEVKLLGDDDESVQPPQIGDHRHRRHGGVSTS